MKYLISLYSNSTEGWSVRYKVLGRTGIKVSAISCGTNALRMQTQEGANLVLNYALDKGINFIETGRPYGATEEMIGKAISHRQNEFSVAAKTVLLSFEEVRKEVDLSLKALKTDYIDLYEAIVNRKEEVEKLLGPSGGLEALIQAKEKGKIGFIGIGGHRPDLLAEVLETNHFDTVLFHFNMVQPYALKDLLPTAAKVKAGTLVMRPIAHGALAPVEKALKFPLACPQIDTVLCGMYSFEEVDKDLTVAEDAPTEREWNALLAEADSLGNTGCRLCGYCSCPKGISIGFIMTLTRYRSKYNLLPKAEETWKAQAEKAKTCDGCGQCEKQCPYGLFIISLIREAAIS